MRSRAGPMSSSNGLEAVWLLRPNRAGAGLLLAQEPNADRMSWRFSWLTAVPLSFSRLRPRG